MPIHRLITFLILICSVSVDASAFNPTRYKLTTEEGREFTIDQQEGIREIFEPEGKNRIMIRNPRKT